jgi:hypothetical protein
MTVTSEQLLALLKQPATMTLSAPTWKVAALLAGLRRAVNDPIRAADRDRGEDKNWLADIWGVIGELVALRRINHLTSDVVEHHPIDFERSVDEVDLVVWTSDGPLRLEAKAHLIEPGKAWFMVNQRAGERSARRGAAGYVPVLSALGAKSARVGRLITIDQLGAWRAPEVALRDPAVGIRLDQLTRIYLDESIGGLKRSMIAGTSIAEPELRAIARQAGTDLERWRRRLPALDRLTAQQLVAAVLAAEQAP